MKVATSVQMGVVTSRAEHYFRRSEFEKACLSLSVTDAGETCADAFDAKGIAKSTRKATESDVHRHSLALAGDRSEIVG